MSKKCWLVGYVPYGTGGSPLPLYLEDFEWQCGWFWAGGYLETKYSHEHFNGLDRSKCLFDAFRAHTLGGEYQVLDDPTLWRLCDLMKQFYAHKESAAAFQYGGHYTSRGRTEAELRPRMAAAINKHIERVIIPEVRALMDAAEAARKKS